MENRVFELSFMERLSLGMFLPQQGNFISLMIVRDLQKELALTEEEMASVKMVIGPGKSINAKGKEINIPEGAMEWDIRLEKKKKITLGPKAFDLVFKALDKAEAMEKLTINDFSLYALIVKPIKEAEEAEKAKK